VYNSIPVKAITDTLWLKLDATGDCWEWIGSRRRHGYGCLQIAGKQYLAHRVVYAVLVGDVPDMTLDHLCRNTSCVNPDHLEPVPMTVNTQRGYGVTANNARKSACPKGHDFDTHGYQQRKGRGCLTCRRDAGRIRARQKRAAERDARASGGKQLSIT
jgi:HNH endonuclease